MIVSVVTFKFPTIVFNTFLQDNRSPFTLRPPLVIAAILGYFSMEFQMLRLLILPIKPFDETEEPMLRLAIKPTEKFPLAENVVFKLSFFTTFPCNELS